MLNHSSTILRRMPGGYVHWCSGCCKIHIIPRSPGDPALDVNCPTLAARVSHIDAANACCSYTLRNGMIEYAPTCRHWLAGRSLPIMTLPEVAGKTV